MFRNQYFEYDAEKEVSAIDESEEFALMDDILESEQKNFLLFLMKNMKTLVSMFYKNDILSYRYYLEITAKLSI